ncbi:PD-(D/E)XK nuclease family protein [Myroides marinus]|uniref:PDDEXK-like family protein n=1 Tax=Myroides marinus TaxID=703342 RepID=UPI002575C8E7|nr:PD-(D/E)XK nuclease family protein [Myroides marinus]MDM1376718.1 PD-(D/E)XK nuclease family protein [Myroides marinus]
MEQLLEAISKLKQENDDIREKERFNIISIFHKEREEKLHSRVISYLLSPYSGHGMGDVYCKMFVSNVLKIKGFDLLDFNVIPNEENKSEYKFIDLLIINKSTSQAIIIENKIDAGDSNYKQNIINSEQVSEVEIKKVREGYIGQLERYYNTIKTGVDKDGLPCPETKCEDVFVYYLTPNGRQPSDDSLGMLKNISKSWNEKSIISYSYDIRTWLQDCINQTPIDKVLVKEFIQHYLKTVNKMTQNDMSINERIALKNIIGENIQNSKYLIDNFKHVKWHTVFEFWEEIVNQLKISGYNSIEIFPSDEKYKNRSNKLFVEIITKITHLNENNTNYGVSFDLKNGNRAYISGLDGLSWGNLTLDKWSDFDRRIDFLDFSSEHTYKLIDTKTMLIEIRLIINEILMAEKNNFCTLKQR